MDLGVVGKVGYNGLKYLQKSTIEGGYWQVFEVLGAEYDDFALSYEEGDLVFGSRRVVAGLDNGDYRACGGCQMFV